MSHPFDVGFETNKYYTGEENKFEERTAVDSTNLIGSEKMVPSLNRIAAGPM
jgi:hypothetical protein